MEILIPEYVREILSKLNTSGYEAYPVGGCVRDTLLGKAPDDWDVCTNALPEQMEEVFGDCHVIETGLMHGTLTVLTDGLPVEVTTYRSDGVYTDHRRPDKVEFVSSLKEDLSRRDLTINALCLDSKGTVIDMFDGREDLEKKLIRCVGDAKERFEEDALRILRALRFSSVLDFDIDEYTSLAICEKAPLLKYVSPERIYAELKKLLCGKRAGRILLEYADVFSQFIPEIAPCIGCVQNNPHHKYDVLAHICKSIDNIEPTPTLRLTMLLHDIAKPGCKTTDENGIDHFKMHPVVGAKAAEEILTRLRADNDTKDKVCELIKEHDNRFPATKRSVGRFISKHGYAFFDDYIKVRYADAYAQSQYHREEKLSHLEGVIKIRHELEAQNACLTVKDLSIGGNDLLALGFKGRQIGESLRAALEAVIDEEIHNDKKELLAFVSEYLKK